jgi:hypothetical protein
VDEIKAADPKRQHVVEVFTVWWKHHSSANVSIGDLHLDVKEAIDLNSKKSASGELVFSRQKLAGFLKKHVGAIVGGYCLKQMGEKTTAQKNTAVTYSLTQDEAVKERP